MTAISDGTTKYPGRDGGYARVFWGESYVLIWSVNAMTEEVATIAMTPAQAIKLAQGIIAAADSVEAGE